MTIEMDFTGTLDGLEEALMRALEGGEVGSLIAFSCDANGFIPESMDPVLQKTPVPLFGGIFPSIIRGNERLEKGSIVLGIPERARAVVVPNLSDPSADYEKVLGEEAPISGDIRTVFALVDGFSQRIGAFIDSLFNVFGLEVNYIGGGAGSLSMVQKPCLFTEQGLVSDSAVLAFLESRSGVGVSHGWRSISGPYRVTRSDRNVIKSLDWRPALDVYREAIREHSGQDITEGDYFDIAKAYPFGVVKFGAERVVRDPLKIGEGASLVCVGEVPEGSFVDILTGNEDSLISAAANAYRLGKEAFGENGSNTVNLFIDCISRVLFLDGAFPKELDAVREDGRPLLGACTIGEIANSGRNTLEFYNKTSVFGILEIS